MKRRLAVALVLMSAVLVLPFGLWTVASADDDDHHGKGGGDKSDFALFDGTNPTTAGLPFGGAECAVREPSTLHLSVTAHSSGPSGFVRFTFKDGDFVQYPIASNGTLSFTQAIGGTKGVDDRIRISNGGTTTGARLVGWASVISDGKVSCQSCNFNDAAGGTGCQNSPGP